MSVQLGRCTETSIFEELRDQLEPVQNLRSMVDQLEADLYQSAIYQQAIAELGSHVGEMTEEIQHFIRMTSQEVIHLALQKLGATQTYLPDNSRLETPQPEPDRSKPEPQKQRPKTLLNPKKFSLKSNRAEQLLQERHQSLQQLGQELRRARVARSISLQQLHEMTWVPLYHIRALEEGQIEQLPEEIYIRGFIGRIAKALGLDSEQVLNQLPASDPNAGLLPSWYHGPTQQGFYLKPVHLYLGYAALMAGAAGGLHLFAQPPSQPALQPDPGMSGTAPSHRISNPQAGQSATTVQTNIAPPETISSVQ